MTDHVDTDTKQAKPAPLSPTRRTFAGIASFQILAMFRRALFYSYLSIYLRFFLGLSVTETTFFATFPMVINILSQSLVWGPLSDRYQKRRTLIILGEITAAIITVLVWYVHILPDTQRMAGYVVIVGLTVVEISWSMSNVGWTAILSDLYPARERSGLQGRLLSVGSLGRIGGLLVGGWLYDGPSGQYEGWGFNEGALFFIASGIMVISTIPMFFLPEGGVEKKAESPAGGPFARLVEEGVLIGGMSRRFLVFLVAMVFIFFGFNSVTLILSQYLTLDTGFDVTSRMLSYILNTASVAIFIMGLLVKPLSRKIRDEYLLLAGTALAVIYLCGFWLAGSIVLIFVFYFLAGAGFSTIMASSYGYASRLIPPEKRGKQFALYNATLFLSWGIPGTLITGPLVDLLIKWGTAEVTAYRMSFLAAAAMVVTGSLILIWDIRLGRKRT